MNMKNYITEFIRRGFIACGFGPLVLAVIYLILKNYGDVQSLAINEVCLGIFSLSTLAFVAGGINVIYQIERIPLAISILIHGVVLYICYLITYLLNGWLQSGLIPLMVFTIVFVIGYLLIWAVIYFITKKNTVKVNEMLKKKQQIKAK